MLTVEGDYTPPPPTHTQTHTHTHTHTHTDLFGRSATDLGFQEFYMQPWTYIYTSEFSRMSVDSLYVCEI